MRKKALVFLLSLTVVACSVFFLGVSPKEKSVNLSLKLATLDSSSPQYQTSLATDMKFGFNPQRNSKLWPQAQIDYMVYDPLDNIWSVSTGAAHIPHQVGR